MKLNRLLASAGLIFLTSTLSGQSQNPFDLSHRLEHIVTTQSTSEIKAPTEEISTNPFDLTPQDRSETPVSLTQDNTPPQHVKADGDTLTSNAIFWLLIFLILLLAVIINLNRDIIGHLLKAWSNQNFSNLLLRDKKRPDSILYTLLGILFYINAGLFIALALNKLLGVPLTPKNTLIYMAGTAAIYFVRHTGLKWISLIFSIGKECRQYSFTIHLFNILTGIFLLIVNLLVAFSPDTVGLVILYIALIIIAIQFIYRNIRGLLLGATHFVSNKVHFFLYLCTCEIAPWVLGYLAFHRMI